MFGIISETKTEEKKHIDEACYGGFEGRIGYELCCREHKARRAVKLLRSAAAMSVCLVLGMIGVLMGMTVYEMVDSHKVLYFPGGSMPESVTAVRSAPDASESESRATITGTSVSDNGAENVTPELSRRYRIPVGVMLRTVDSASAAAAMGLESGDIIVAVSGVEISDAAVLERLIDEAVGTVELTVFRNNQYLKFIMMK